MATVAEEMTIDGTATFPRSDQQRPVVAGHYEIDFDEPLGSGGMAVVYHGRDLRTRRDVALKTLRIEYRKDPETRARFRKEARTMAFLTHPNVIKVYDLFEDDDAPWVVLEYAPGRSLKEEIATRGPYSVEETAKLLDQIAKALDHLHGRGMVHLDVKPQNVIVTPDLSVKLIDFGLAQNAGEPQEMIGGSAFGTAAYLSPEQACGEPVDSSTDVYALGCVVYEMLTGQPPFGNDPSSQLKNDIIRSHLEHDPDPPSSLRTLPAWVDDAVLLALAKKPRDRYRDCASFARVFWTGIDEPEGIVNSGNTTARLWTPPIVDTYEVEPEPQRQIGRQVAGGLYRTGARVARHTGWLRRLMWRATIALLVGNVFLAGLLYADRGEVPGLIAGGAELRSGATARVTTDRLRLRSEPGRESGVLGLLALDQEVRVTGPAEQRDDEAWWPVRATLDGESLEGYVSGGWLEPVGGPGKVWLQRAMDELETVPGRLLDEIGVGFIEPDR
jgi:predicted Ser/Thr protein kinase